MAQAIMLCILLAATVNFKSAYALPYRWSDYYRDGAALYRNQNVARFQEQCPVNEPSFDCKTARLTGSGGIQSNTFVHVCPNSGNDQQPVCYNSRLRRCCQSNVEANAFKCVSATTATVGSHQVTIEIYEHPTEGHCVYFDSDVDVRSCCNPGDEELPCVCVPMRDIYFVLDTTQSIGSSIFCTFSYVIQLIEAAVNPSGGSEGARVSTILFANEFNATKIFGATHLFKLSDSCNTAVKTNIPRVVYEYDYVAQKQQQDLNYDTDKLLYPQVGAKTTQPNSALNLAFEDIKAYSANRPATVIILTDGEPQQTVTLYINRLKGVTVDLIAAGIGSSEDISIENLKELASSDDDVIYEENLSNVVSFAIRIVERMRDTAALCSDQAKRILDTLKLEDVTNLDSFCSKCMFTESPSDDCKNKQFPQCGANNLQMQMASSMDNKELEKLILEEQILAEVEKIMEMDGELRKQELPKEQFISLTPV